MRILRNVTLACCCSLLLAFAASAQMGMGMRRNSMPAGMFNPVVGSGAAYDMTTADGQKSNIEYAIVGKESVNGKDGFWMEWTTSGAAMGPMGNMVMKVLVVPGDTSGSTRMIMQMAGKPPMEMPTQMGRPGGAPPPKTQPSDIRNDAEDVGSETITVPAGTFTCEHYRMKDGSGDTWVSPKVAPLGVVKHQGKDQTMVLTKVETDAKDKIVGTPQPFNPAMMMQGAPQQ